MKPWCCSIAMVLPVLPLISSVLSSRKRTTATSNTTAITSTQSSTKRARRQRNNEVETAIQTLSSEIDTSSSPPSLELSHTFTFESSSSDSPTTSSIEHNNDDTHTTTEYYTALSAHAKQRIHTAQLLETQSKENLIRAQIQYEQSTAEFQNAVQFYNGVEKRQWGSVIDVVDSASSCGSSLGSKLEMSSSFNNDVKEIQISQAGLSICNGMYKLDTTATTTKRGPIYTHIEGPITIQNDELYDMCIFQRYGYGDKIRWCIGLVPHRPTFLDENDEVETVAMQTLMNDQLFLRAYIYYWKEVDAIINTTNMHDTLLLQNDNSSWGVCHGTRPLPILTNISGNRKWWQFWKA